MRRQSPSVANPFVMLTEPQSILQAIERSERLNALQRRVCRPLDKPLIPKAGAEDLELDIDGDFAAAA
jgi:hypothetical protein